ncbi:MAG: aldo/keto reductase [Actinomycetota bacterium]
MTNRPIDPATIPRRTLADGSTLPAIGVGTFGSDHVGAAEVARAVDHALRIGYRHIDTAAVYRNEREIGEVLAARTARGLRRDDLWISSKLWNDAHRPEDVAPACERTLADLGLDHLDAYLVHWPFPNHHAAGASVHDRHVGAVGFDADRYLSTWQAMEALVDRGLVRHLGTSNMTEPKLDAVLPGMRRRPAVNQMELHPHHQQPALFRAVVDAGIVPIGFCPIGSPARPERDRTPDDSSPVDDEHITTIAARHGVHPATVCVAWAHQRGQVPIPFSTNPDNLAANLRAVCELTLREDEMETLAGIDRDCRLIKGQVFLWREGQDWRDLWDEDGVIVR